MLIVNQNKIADKRQITGDMCCVICTFLPDNKRFINVA